ncbi:MAG: hypothetical protein BWY80_00801 [Firmicutes bacterium ADurb.Bin456]|nr:MAG: hypothetical protein BWY80_00801 [Firmicutes bacterium ADurb.Bin456]
MGFCKRPCRTTPEEASPAPTRTARTTLASLIWKIMVSWLAGQPPEGTIPPTQGSLCASMISTSTGLIWAGPMVEQTTTVSPSTPKRVALIIRQRQTRLAGFTKMVTSLRRFHRNLPRA